MVSVQGKNYLVVLGENAVLAVLVLKAFFSSKRLARASPKVRAVLLGDLPLCLGDLPLHLGD